MSILVTGAAGFIGYHVCEALLKRGETVLALDNVNDYYDVALKRARLQRLTPSAHFQFLEADIADPVIISALAVSHPDLSVIVHLAAQAGVRYSLENPRSYVRSNLVGHLEMLELARALPNLRHFVYASSSSVYGANAKLPFSIEDQCREPCSLYAATKIADEAMTHSYVHLYGFPATGLRFFTVYGPWGRPDMAPMLFANAILTGQPIRVFNDGNMQRDFTYIDDVVAGILQAVDRPPSGDKRHRLYNLGNHQAEPLMRFIAVLEQACGKPAQVRFESMQPGDVQATYAEIGESTRDLNFLPHVGIDAGIPRFVEWYRSWTGL